MRTLSGISLWSLLLAFTCAGTESSMASSGQGVLSDTPDVLSLVDQLRVGSAEEKIEAAVQLGAMGPYAQPAVDQLVKSLETNDAALRYECLVALGHVGPLAHGSADSLTRFLSSDSELLQSAALESLRRIGTASPEASIGIRRLCISDNASLATSAVRSLVMIEGVDSEIVRTSIPRLLAALGDERPDVRNEAAVTLVEIGPSVVSAVAGALSSTDPRVRLKACEILGHLGPVASPTVPLLLARLGDEELVVRAAATALGEIHSEPKTVLPALNTLVQQESIGVRITAVRAIAEFGPLSGDSTSLMLNLLGDKSFVLRASAAHALGRIGDSRPEVIDGLVKALSEGNGALTINAANALSQMGMPAVDALIRQLSDKDYQGLVVEILGEMGSGAESAVPALVELLNSVGDDKSLQREVFIALASIGPKAAGAIPAMMKILANPAAGDARAGAAYVLARIGEKQALPILKKILMSAESERVLRSAAWAIVTLEPKNSENVNLVMPHLIQATTSDMPLARREAMAAFATLGPMASAALPTLLQHAATDAEASVRAESLHGLAEIQATASRALPVAIASLGDPDPTVRNSARYLLGRLGKDAQDAAPLLRQTLRRGDEFERIISAWALMQVAPSPKNTQDAIPLLLKGLQHSNPRVRVETASTLGAIGGGSKEVLSALESSKNDEDPLVQEAVTKALSAVHQGK